jgi:hypothetical protein
MRRPELALKFYRAWRLTTRGQLVARAIPNSVATQLQHLISLTPSCHKKQQLLVLDRTSHCTFLSHGDIHCDS